jgi:hypothetical protein
MAQRGCVIQRWLCSAIHASQQGRSASDGSLSVAVARWLDADGAVAAASRKRGSLTGHEDVVLLVDVAVEVPLEDFERLQEVSVRVAQRGRATVRDSHQRKRSSWVLGSSPRRTDRLAGSPHMGGGVFFRSSCEIYVCRRLVALDFGIYGLNTMITTIATMRISER